MSGKMHFTQGIADEATLCGLRRGEISTYIGPSTIGWLQHPERSRCKRCSTIERNAKGHTVALTDKEKEALGVALSSFKNVLASHVVHDPQSAIEYEVVEAAVSGLKKVIGRV